MKRVKLAAGVHATEGDWEREVPARDRNYDQGVDVFGDLGTFDHEGPGAWKTSIWSCTDLGDNVPPAVWIATQTEICPAEGVEEAFAAFVEWVGLRIDGSEPGAGYTQVVGDAYGTMDFGLPEAVSRRYDEGVFVYAAAEDEDTLQKLLARIHVNGDRELKPATRRKVSAPATLEQLLAPESVIKKPKSLPGPASQRLFRLAASVAKPSMTLTATLSDDSEVSMWADEGIGETSWMLTIDGVPGGGALSDSLEYLQRTLGKRTAVSATASLKRPKANAAVEAEVAALMMEVMRELASKKAKPARKSGR